MELLRKGCKSLKERWKPLEMICVFGMLLIFVVLVIFPLIVLISASFSSSDDLLEKGAKLIPLHFTFDAYKSVFQFPNEMLKSYGLSLFISIFGTILNLILCAPVAYAISRDDFAFKKPVTYFFIFTIMFNAGYVPQYILFRNYLFIFDTVWVLIFPPLVNVSYIILLRVFYTTIPKALSDSAKIDGASEYRTFLQISTPLILPGLSTVAFYSVLFYWNDPTHALLYTDNVVPIATYLTRITQYIEFLKWAQNNGILDIGSSRIPEQTILYAVAVCSSAPMLLAFTFFQKFFVQGLTTGSVKG